MGTLEKAGIIVVGCLILTIVVIGLLNSDEDGMTDENDNAAADAGLVETEGGILAPEEPVEEEVEERRPMIVPHVDQVILRPITAEHVSAGGIILPGSNDDTTRS